MPGRMVKRALHRDVMNLDLFPPEPPATRPLERLLRGSRIYLEPEAGQHPRGQDILARFPEAERVEVRSHWNIPGLHGNEGNVESWNRIKGSTLVLGVKKTMRFETNGRSADFLPPSAGTRASWGPSASPTSWTRATGSTTSGVTATARPTRP